MKGDAEAKGEAMRRIPRMVVTGALVAGLIATAVPAAASASAHPAAPPGGGPGSSDCGEVLRTSPSQFRNLEGYPYRPNYARVGPCQLRMHYLDEGPRNGPVVLLAHGNPAWSYMYRDWIPQLASQGYRVIAPDLIGFGKSDKLAREQYSYENQVAWASSLVARLGLRDVTLYGQDWGGLVYLRVVSEQPERFARVAISNTGLPDRDEDFAPAFRQWQQTSQVLPAFGPVIEGATATELTDAEEAAYDAPWPTEELKGAARQMPLEVPTTGDDQAAANAAAKDFFRTWQKPMLVLWSEEDTVTTPGVKSFFLDEVPGAQGLAHRDYPAGHFIQEDFGDELVGDLLHLMRTT